MTIPLFLIILVSFCFVVFNFFFYAIKGRVKTRAKLFKAVQIWTVVLVPTFFILIFDFWEKNDCCTDGALFSPEHSIGIYSLLIAYTLGYLISIFRKSILPPVVELFINSFLILGLIINIVLCIHINKMELGIFYWSFGNFPIILLLLIELSKNQKLLSHHIEQNELNCSNSIGVFCIAILRLKPILKYPILAIILVPILILLSLFLLLFGQKPDSIISAFTETYKHGF